MRLRTVSPADPGWGRRKSGQGFAYFDEDGNTLTGADSRRCRDLVIPPAWQRVWICPLPNGHIQAVGFDARKRKQYLYHPIWREKRDLIKHDHVLELARRLPNARKKVAADLTRDGMPIERALATAFRLLDLGYFRIGSDSYATENGSYGLTTLERRHVRRSGKRLLFEFQGKSGVNQQVEILDADVLASVSTMRKRQSTVQTLLAYRSDRRWSELSAADINDYLKQLLGTDVSAKDFRTWHGTVRAATSLARNREATARARKKAVSAAYRDVADHLGNTPAVARSAYVDPRLITLYEHDNTIEATLSRLDRKPVDTVEREQKIERAVLALLRTSG